VFHPTEVKKPVKLALSVCADDAEADIADPQHMYYVNDGVYGSFNCILYDHVTVEASLVDVSAFLDFTEARDSECQWRQLGRMQVCTSLQTDNHTSTPPWWR